MKSLPITDLIFLVKKELLDLGYSKSTVSSFAVVWNRLKAYMEHNSLKQFSMGIGFAFLEADAGKELLLRTPPPSDVLQKIRSINLLGEYQIQKTIRPMGYFRKYHCPEFADKALKAFREYALSKLELAPSTVAHMDSSLHKFCSLLLGRGITDFSRMTVEDIHAYSLCLSSLKKKTLYNYLYSVRRFIEYLVKEGIIAKEVLQALPKVSRPDENDGIPSAYNADEIKILLGSVDRANPAGKRLYAMMLLSILFGLRGGEICNLKLSDIDWENNTVHVIHKKGNKESHYPLLPEIGNAIADYLQHGRPEVNLPYVFLSAGRPIKKTTTASFSHGVAGLIRRSNIAVPKGKKTGCHVLRHSCATMLLEEGTEMSVISEVLAHTSTETTGIYTKVDIKHLRQCALDVTTLLEEE